ncbi:hypothetical protein ACQKII_24535 [Lysinibacillus sp. NPDC048646]|uniref:hypothetical protein n=1 Tax=Lysinibacillus sp. NPDC048646 TaxID=3390574 RepID=UPI003D050879
MNKYKHFSTLIVSVILTLFGFIKITNCIENAKDSTFSYIQSMGGSVNSDEALLMQNGSILVDITLGGIMFLVGLSFLCVSIYTLTKNNN